MEVKAILYHMYNSKPFSVSQQFFALCKKQKNKQTKNIDSGHHEKTTKNKQVNK